MSPIFHGTAAERDTIHTVLKFHAANVRTTAPDLAAELDRLCERLSAPVAPPSEISPDVRGMSDFDIVDAIRAQASEGAYDLPYGMAVQLVEKHRLSAQPPQVPEPVSAELLNALVNADHLLRALIANHDIRLTDLGQGILAKIDKEKARAESALAAQKDTP